jgi:hypothetical protein
MRCDSDWDWSQPLATEEKHLLLSIRLVDVIPHLLSTVGVKLHACTMQQQFCNSQFCSCAVIDERIDFVVGC